MYVVRFSEGAYHDYILTGFAPFFGQVSIKSNNTNSCTPVVFFTNGIPSV